MPVGQISGIASLPFWSPMATLCLFRPEVLRLRAG